MKNADERKEYMKKYNTINKNRIKENCKKYYIKNKETIIKYKKIYNIKWRIDNKEYIKQHFKKYYIANKEFLKEETRKWRTDNKEYIKQSNKKYKEVYNKTDKGKILNKISRHRRRALLKKTVFDLTTRDIDKIVKRDTSCVYCNSFKSLAFDHIKPLSKGGDTTFGNMVLACKSCNSSKNNKNVFFWCKSKNITVPKIVILLLLKNIKQEQML